MPNERIAEEFLQTLLAADSGAASGVVRDALAEGLDGYAVLDDVIAPSLYEVGRLWELGRVTIADEHLATAIAHRVLVSVYPVLVTAEPRSRDRVLMAGSEGEEHVLGLRIAADVLEGAGFEVQYAGASLPLEALLQAMARHRPRIVGLSSTFAFDHGGLRETVETLREAQPHVGILLGGARAGDVERFDGVRSALSAREVVPAAEEILAELGPRPEPVF
jgi:methanogenic corrinoid protein MtbC1